MEFKALHLFCAPQHIFQVLTKRPERVVTLADRLDWTPNIWMGTSVESMKVVERVDQLRKLPARIRFLSCLCVNNPDCLDQAILETNTVQYLIEKDDE